MSSLLQWASLGGHTNSKSQINALKQKDLLHPHFNYIIEKFNILMELAMVLINPIVQALSIYLKQNLKNYYAVR